MDLFDDEDGDEWLQSKVPTRRKSVTTSAESAVKVFITIQ